MELDLFLDMTRSQLVEHLTFEFKYEKDENLIDKVLEQIADASHG